MHRHMNRYIEESLKEYGPNKFFLFDKYFWMSLFEIPLKSKEVPDKKVRSVNNFEEELKKFHDSIGFE